MILFKDDGILVHGAWATEMCKTKTVNQAFYEEESSGPELSLLGECLGGVHVMVAIPT